MDVEVLGQDLSNWFGPVWMQWLLALANFEIHKLERHKITSVNGFVAI